VADDITDFYVHTVTVQTRLGIGASGGDVYAAAQTAAGFLDGKTQLVRSTDGEQVVSASQFYCSLIDAAKFTPDSKVTLPDGRTAQVIIVNSLDVAGMPDFAGVEHAAIYLT
jgi:formylmethanofuran dehydrogenase subunit D